ncbi:MAG TPA: hypothetical protein DCW29_20375 [Janthinobacterium sp.]|nr:hypothetical protein [Janthinobacterium sp.]
MKRLLFIYLFCGAAAHAGTQDASRASENVGAGSGIVLIGSLSMLAASGEVLVTGVETVADGTIVMLKGASNAATVSVKLSGQAATDVSQATGKAVGVIAVSTGYALILSGKVIAYIPGEIGKSLLHHSAVTEPGA